MSVRLAPSCLGLRLGLETHPKELGALGFVLLNSPNFAEAAANAQRYMQIHQTHAEIDARLEGGSWHLSYRVPELKLANLYQDGEYTVGTIVSVIRVLTGGSFESTEVHLRRGRPPNSGDYEGLLSSPVSFGRPRDAVVVNQEVMTAEVAGADPDLLPVLEAHAQTLIQHLPVDEDELLSDLRRLIAESIRSGPPNLGKMARQLGMSERTLQRRLDERGVSFQHVAEEIREHLAREYLAQQELSLGGRVPDRLFRAQCFRPRLQAMDGANPRKFSQRCTGGAGPALNRELGVVRAGRLTENERNLY